MFEPSKNPTRPFSFRSEHGYALISKIVQMYAPFQPHDYVLEGIAALLDGLDLIAITPTGSGKTGYISFTTLVVRELTTRPANYPEIEEIIKRFPKNPLVLAICPTNYLEYQLLSSIGLKILVINNDTKAEAQKQNLPDLWTTVINDTTLDVLLLSPEQLTTEEFAKLLKEDSFCARLYALSIDEVHLLLTWGNSFRKSFQQIGLVRSRLPDNVVMMGLTATMRGGIAFKNVCQFLGLRNNDFHLIRRSNQRHDIDLVFREVSSSIDGDSFPELHWVLRRGRNTIIFCRTIGLGYRIHRDLYSYDESIGGNPQTVADRMREYNSLDQDYNEETRLLIQSGDCTIIIATSALAVGVDVEGIEDVVIYGDPEDVDQLLQMFGRIRQHHQHTNMQRPPQGIVYFNSSARKRAEETVSNPNSGDNRMDEGLARLYLSKCKVDCIDDLYDNPRADKPCACPTCLQSPPSPRQIPCSCSGCNLKLFIPNAPSRSVQDSPESSAKPKKHQRISLAMRAHGTRELKKFRYQISQRIYRNAALNVHLFSPRIFFADDKIKQVLDNFIQINELADVTRLLQRMKNEYLIPFDTLLFTRLQQMKGEFERIQADKKRQKDEERLQG
ncbi:P-loop containing nucleoside triphosphate hydrolase protein [Lentinula raphanica]|nr:P-loop containing nucleoside triphosphate hydrolase protein [Lentinula raphanica]